MDNNELIVDNLSKEITELVIKSRKKLKDEMNNEQIKCYWDIGRKIIEEEQKGKSKAEYGKGLLINLSKKLKNELGKGFSRTNLQNMRLFYQYYPKCQTSGKLSWSHYCELIMIKEKEKREFYEKECINSKWAVRELKRQIESSLYERLLLSDGNANKEKVLKLSKEGHVIEKPEDILKDPYVFEFLGIPENKPVLEKDLEYKLIKHIEDFLLELGKGFMFVGSQQRVTLGNTHYYVDMVFYNKILKCYVLIDLKIGHLKPENMGQMNMYLNYYEKEVNTEEDNKPIGIVLCAEKDEIVAEYSLEGLNNNIFASQYTYCIPDKEQLIKEVEKVLRENGN